MSRSRRPRSRAANVARLEHPELWERYWRLRLVEDRNALVEAILPRAVNSASKALRGVIRARPHDNFGLTCDERAEVAIALIRLVTKYDPSLATFNTYAWRGLLGSVVELWRRQGWFPRRWFSKGSCDVSMLSLDKIREDREKHQDCWVPNELVDHDSARDAEDAALAHDECLLHLSRLQGLDELVIRMRYINDVPFKSIARHLGVTRQRVCFIHRRALDIIREAIEKES